MVHYLRSSRNPRLSYSNPKLTLCGYKCCHSTVSGSANAASVARKGPYRSRRNNQVKTNFRLRACKLLHI